MFTLSTDLTKSRSPSYQLAVNQICGIRNLRVGDRSHFIRLVISLGERLSLIYVRFVEGDCPLGGGVATLPGATPSPSFLISIQWLLLTPPSPP